MVKGYKNRYLKEHGKTSAQRINPVFFIKIKEFLVHFLAVVLVPLLDDFYIGLNFLHPFH